METFQQQLITTEDKIIPPLVEILESVKPNRTESPTEVSKSINKSLSDLFPEQQYEEKSIQKAKDVLGDLSKQFVNSQLRDLVSEVRFLTESWLDDFEREIFSGLTLNEFLHDKSNRE